MRPWRAQLLAIGLVAAACSNSAETPSQPSDRQETNAEGGNASAPTTTEAADCSAKQLQGSADLPSDPTSAALAISQEVFTCSSLVVIADKSVEAVATGAELAIDASAPLLVADPSVEADRQGAEAEVARLGASRVVYVGEDTTGLPADWEISTEPLGDADPDIFSSNEFSNSEGIVWAASSEELTTAFAVLPSITAGGGRIVLEGEPSGVAPGDIAVIGDLDATQRWQLLSPAHAAQLPGGGVTVFPGRRIVAYYGSPVTFRLGLLGERGPERVLAELEALADEYAIPGGDPVIPGFEIIATVADSKPGDDGDYSNELTVGQMREWLDLASANEVFILIDLQPGRTDFLTQAQRYEELLRLPNVGLALDPEWRLEPDEVHLTQIGSVDAAEVNEVVDWLAQLVQEEMLPQKILVLHQFNLQMISNRELIDTPPELAVVVHVDGQGPLGSKYGTYDDMVGAPVGLEQTLWWGWKNFIDEDFPTAKPSQVNAIEPLPVVITYQ